jgi:hypothetical protein
MTWTNDAEGQKDIIADANVHGDAESCTENDTVRESYLKVLDDEKAQADSLKSLT